MTDTATAASFRFDDPRLARFVRELSGEPEGLSRDDRSVPVRDITEFRLLQRLNDGQASVVRYRDSHTWMITGVDERDLIQTVTQLERFLVPTYGWLLHPTANVQPFDPAKGGVQALGQQAALAGYHRLETQPASLPRVRAALQTWVRLTERRPSGVELRRPTYRELLSAFRTALATADWPAAQETVAEVTRHRLTSADNELFLFLQLQAKQERWAAIWGDPRFGEWARQRVPRVIRTALIQSFHYAVLVPRELDGDWEGALEQFRGERPRLGQLLGTRLQENSWPVASVYAYVAVDGADHELAAALRQSLPDDVLRRIEPILALLPAREDAPKPPPFTVEMRAKIALLDGDLDLVRTLVAEIDDAVTRTALFVDLADRSRDLPDVERALTEATDLPDKVLDGLFSARPYLKMRIDELETLLAVPDEIDVAAVMAAPLTWRDWFAEVRADGKRPVLEPALDSLIAKSDERLWDVGDARAIGNDVLGIITEPRDAPVALVRRAIEALTDDLLIDDAFPRPGDAYVELYEAVYTFMLESAARNEPNSKKVLRLAEAILGEDPSRVAGIHLQLRDWFSIPRTILAERMLDGLELVADYGVDGGLLVNDLRPWAEALLTSPNELPSATVNAWSTFARAIQAGEDLLKRFQTHAATHTGSLERLIEGLPANFRIVIFTLRPKSAARVKDALIAMNAKIDIQILDDKDLSPRVQQLAASADLPVVVTTCITHALTYGIGPLLRAEPARPDSSGSSSIMRSIELAIQAR